MNLVQNIFNSLFSKRKVPEQAPMPYKQKAAPPMSYPKPQNGNPPMSYPGQSSNFPTQRQSQTPATEQQTNNQQQELLRRVEQSQPSALEIRRSNAYRGAGDIATEATKYAEDARRVAEAQKAQQEQEAQLIAERQRQQYEGAKAPIIQRFADSERASQQDIQAEERAVAARRASEDERYQRYLRETALARQHGIAQNDRTYALSNSADSYGVGSRQVANQNVESDMERKRQMAYIDRENKYAQIESDLAKYRTDVQRRVAQERAQKDQALSQIENAINLTNDQKIQALNMIQAKHQERVAGINQEERAAVMQARKMQQEADNEYNIGLAERRDSQPSLAFMQTGKPQTQQDFQFLVKNPQGAKTIAELLKGGTHGKPLSPGEQSNLSDFDSSVRSMQGLTGLVNQYKNMFGPIAGKYYAENPYNTDAMAVKSQIKAVAQMVGRAMEGGVLRQEDVPKYEAILPNLTDTPDVAMRKIQNVTSLLQQQRDIRAQGFRDIGYDVGGSGMQGGADPLGLGL